MENKKNSRQFLFLALLIIRILYEICIVWMLPDRFAYWSYDKKVVLQNVAFEVVPFLIGLVVFTNNYKRESVVSLYGIFMFVMGFIPSNASLSLQDNNPIYYFEKTVFYLILISIVSLMCKNDRCNYEEIDSNIWEDRRLLNTMRIVLIIVSILIILYVYNYNKLNFAMIFSEMYETRASYAEYAASNSGTSVAYTSMIIRRLFTWILPICFYYALMKRRIIDIIICLFTYLAMYTVEMQKSTLFIVAVIAFVAYIEKNKGLDVLNKSILIGFIVLFMTSILSFAIRNESIIFNVIIRRLFYDPQYLENKYYDFFSNNSRLLFRQDAFLIQNILSKISERPYDTNAVGVISGHYFKNIMGSPNTGMFAEAYTQVGAFGVIVFPFIHGFVIKKMRNSAVMFGKGATCVILIQLFLTELSQFLIASTVLAGIIVFIFITSMIRLWYTKRVH